MYLGDSLHERRESLTAVELTDADILLRLADVEDAFTERKTVNDLNDCLKTVVAFANSTPVGYPAILFVGVRDGGEVEGIIDPDKLQRSVSSKIANVYPPIYTTTRVLEKDGKKFLAAIIPGSEDRPHFAGQAYVRDGSKSVVASDEQFERLIAERNSKTYEILKWRGKQITLNQAGHAHALPGYRNRMTVVDCNEFYVTLRDPNPPLGLSSYPLRIIELNYDHEDDRLELRLRT